jgi:hypothetical protein
VARPAEHALELRALGGGSAAAWRHTAARSRADRRCTRLRVVS